MRCILATIPLLLCSAIEWTQWDDDLSHNFVGIFTIQTIIEGYSKSSCIFRGLPVFVMRTTRWAASCRTCHIQCGLGGWYFCRCRIRIVKVGWWNCMIDYSRRRIFLGWPWFRFRNPKRRPLLRAIVCWRVLVGRYFFFTELFSFSHLGRTFLAIGLFISVYSSVSARIISDDTCIYKYLSISTFT